MREIDRQTRPWPRRRSVRLRGRDYARQGAYYVTLCLQGKRCLMGWGMGDRILLSAIGRMVDSVWMSIPGRFPWVLLDACVIMPNHVHGILRFHARGIAQAKAAGRKVLALGDVVGWFKAATTRRYGCGVRTLGWPAYQGRLWQRSYYDHVIRDEEEMAHARGYVARNPRRWGWDAENPVCSEEGADRGAFDVEEFDG